MSISEDRHTLDRSVRPDIGSRNNTDEKLTYHPIGSANLIPVGGNNPKG